MDGGDGERGGTNFNATNEGEERSMGEEGTVLAGGEKEVEDVRVVVVFFVQGHETEETLIVERSVVLQHLRGSIEIDRGLFQLAPFRILLVDHGRERGRGVSCPIVSLSMSRKRKRS